MPESAAPSLESLVAELSVARRTGGEIGEPPPLTLGEGYRIAAQLAGELGTVAGWKAGATSSGAQKFLGTAEPIYGRIFSDGLWQSGMEVRLAGPRAAEAEPEILVLMARDPDPELRQADVAAIHLGLEINRPSREDALRLGAPFIVADNAAHVGLVIGPAIDPALLTRPAEIAVKLHRSGSFVSEGDASVVLGDPLAAARWLVRVRAGSERPVRAGDWLATGAMSRAAVLAEGDEVVADFGPLGIVKVRRAGRGKVMPSDGE